GRVVPNDKNDTLLLDTTPLEDSVPLGWIFLKDVRSAVMLGRCRYGRFTFSN
ncbi:9146_t:CDS:1, partial [Entrophospora sp. SA101]